ncbi:CHAT domain-containing protein [Saccharothrix deserti]|uniref:CHAT domain-containing protein n=1 Tax=Saccharothrix deserti TaxID=2593674 RepID=UPI00131B88F3|nr:CHAT domain-containing protein [Saccharothrix deserti]
MLRKFHVDRAYRARKQFFAEKTRPNLDRAIDLLTAALRRFPPYSDDVERVLLALNLGNLLTVRFKWTKTRADVNAAVECLREAADHPHGPRHLCAMGLTEALEARYTHYFEDEDARELIDMRREVLRLTPGNRPEHVAALLALDRTIKLWAVANDVPYETRIPLDDGLRDDESTRYLTSGVAVVRRLEHGGDPPELDRAIRLVRHGLALAVSPHRRTTCQVLLAWLLLKRYDIAHDTADVDEALKLWGKLADVRGEPVDGMPPVEVVLDTFARTLHTAFKHTGAMHYLKKAVTYACRAEREHPADGETHYTYQYNLSIALGTLADETDNDATRDKALRFIRSANDACPDSNPRKPSYLSRLSSALRDVPGEVDEAVRFGRAALALAGPGHQHHVEALKALGAALMRRGKATAHAGDLDEAIRHMGAAVAATRGRIHHESLVDLAVCHVARYETLHDEESRRAAVAALRVVAGWPLGTPDRRVDAAREWGYLERLAGNWAEAATAYETAVELLGHTAPSSIPVADRNRVLGTRYGLASDAAACFLQIGDVERAVELLELGRGVMLARGIDARSDLAELTTAHPRLAEEFERLRTAVDTMDADETGGQAFDDAMNLLPRDRGDREPPSTGDFGWRERLIARRDAKLVEIRGQDGFERFLLAPRAADLVAAASDGPIVIVNVSPVRCDAIILDRGGIDLVALEGVSPDSIEAALDDDEDDYRWFTRSFGWLWDMVASPVLTRLDLSDHPRLWWCATGVLSALPLHAAGHHDRPGQSVVDHVVSSYTPTVRALIHARKHSAVRPGGPVVAVSMPSTPDQDTLPGAAAEVALLSREFPGSTVTLTGPQATHTSVREALVGARVAHFACHAVAQPGEPSASRLLLEDHEAHPLTVHDISRLRLDSAELAFLSACESADSGGVTVADEALSLAVAFQLAGFPRVVASLWPVSDTAAKRIVRDFYQVFANTSGGDAAAKALHEAALRFRKRRPELPFLWAPFIHSGA